MASGSQAVTDGGGRSGGKILKRRGTGARKTPYDRPTPPPQPESPNWFNGLVFPAKFVVGGASKLFSSFWNPKSVGSSSSPSNSGSDSEDVSEDNEDISDEIVELNQKKGNLSGKGEILHLVEQLLKLEHYSREECGRLIEIINSRAEDDDTMGEEVDAGPSKILSRIDVETSDVRDQAIMEAKKLITKSMAGSSSKSDLDNGIHGSKSILTPHKDHLSAGSWNIQDEIRRLRNKATEDMLSNHRSTKLPESATEHDFPEQSLANDDAIEIIEVNEQISLEARKPEDETLNPASEEGTQGLSDTRITQNDVTTEPLSSLPTIEEQYQIAEGQDAGFNKSHTVHSNNEQNPRNSGEETDLEKEVSIVQPDQRPKADRTEGNDKDSKKVGNANGSVGNKGKLSRKGYSPSARRVETRSTRYSRSIRSRAK